MANTKRVSPTVRDPGNAFERDVKGRVDDINRSSIVQGIATSATFDGVNTTQVPHKLGRPYKGFFAVDNTVGAIIFRDTTITEQPEIFIPLKASSACTLTVWIF